MNNQSKWPTNAPDWANYRTTDADGKTVWHEHRPQPNRFYWNTSNRYQADVSTCPNWRDTLIERPKPVKQKIDWSKLQGEFLVNRTYGTSGWIAWNCDEHTRGNPLPDGLEVEWYYGKDSYWHNKTCQQFEPKWNDVTRFRIIGIQEGWE